MVDLASGEETAHAQFEDAFAESAGAGGGLPHIDPVLYEILTSEVNTHLGVIDAYIAEAQHASPPLPASEPLLRAVHTLNGAIAMVEIPIISHVLAPLEGYIKCLRAGSEAPTAAGLAALSDASALTRSVMAALDRGDAQLPDAGDLSERITRLRDAFPEPQLMHVLFSESNDIAYEPAPQVEEAPEVTTEHEATFDVESAGFAAAGVSEADVHAADESTTSARSQDEDAALLAALEALDQSAVQVAAVEVAADESADALNPDDSGAEAESIVLGGSIGTEDAATEAWVQQQLEEHSVEHVEPTAAEAEAELRASEPPVAADEPIAEFSASADEAFADAAAPEEVATARIHFATRTHCGTFHRIAAC